MTDNNDMGVKPRTDPVVKVNIMPSGNKATINIEPGKTTLKKVIEKIPGYKYNSNDQVFVDNKPIKDHSTFDGIIMQDGLRIFITTNQMGNN